MFGFRTALLLWLLSYTIAVNAKPQKTIDSIEALLPQQKDTALAASYNELTWQYRSVNRGKAIAYGRKAAAYSKQLHYLKGEAQAYNDLGILYMDAQDFDASLDAYAKAIPIRKKLDDKKGLAAVYLKIGIVYQKWGKYDKALDNAQQALARYEELKDPIGCGTALNNIGILNTNIGHTDEALRYYEKAIVHRQAANDLSGLAVTYMNMGNAYFFQEKLDTAKHYFEWADSLGTLTNAKEVMATSAHNIAGIYEKNGAYASGIPYVQTAVTLRQALNDVKGLSSSYCVWGGLLTGLKQYKAAEAQLTEALALCDTLSSCLPEKLRIYRNLNRLYAASGDYKKASEMAGLALVYKDSIYTADMNQRFSDMEIKYETAVKEQQIQQQQFELTKRNYLLAGISGLLLLLALLAYSGYKRFLLKKERQLQAEIIHQQDIASKGIIEAEERERKRIAGDLHDGLGQLFSAVKMNLNAMGSSLQFADEQTSQSFEKTTALVDESCREIRSISHQMMPNTLLKYGLASAVRDFISKIDSRQLRVYLEIFGLNERLDANTETVLYRVLQETVNNVIKHAGATQLDIQLSKDEDGITAMVEDNGKGFDMAGVDQREGIGLKNIRTRIEYLKGTVEFDSTLGRGTVVSVWVPLGKPA